MAGYLVNLKPLAAVHSCVEHGNYSTIIPGGIQPNATWRATVEGTFADYASMKAGDNIYFFSERLIYGIGSLVNLGADCKYLNYPGSNRPAVFEYSQIQQDLLFDFGQGSENMRFICFFEPMPSFFARGVDMDDVLASDPDKFKIIPSFYPVSFIKFGGDENQALKDIILQRNLDVISNPSGSGLLSSNFTPAHAAAMTKVTRGNYHLDIAPFLSTVNENGKIAHEMAVEAALVYQLSTRDSHTVSIFGMWDYVSHQVIASPFKPLQWVDKIDVFGYSFIPNHPTTVGRYLVIEFKRDLVKEEDVLQLMRYVDWVKAKYAMGDYTMIDAFLVGFEFEEGCIQNLKDRVERNFIHGTRPAMAKTWRGVKLVRYQYNDSRKRLDFDLLADATIQ